MKFMVSLIFKQLEELTSGVQRHIFRLLLSCALTLIIYFILPQDHHDLRWQLRKNQTPRNDIVILYLENPLSLSHSKESVNHFWKTLTEVHPKGVIILDSRLIDASIELPPRTFIASEEPFKYGTWGPLGFDKDSDEINRHVHIVNSGQKTLFAHLYNQLSNSDSQLPNPLTLNFVGTSSTIPSMVIRNFSTIDNYKSHLVGKWIIIDPLAQETSILNTPVGRLHRAEFSAQLLQNLIEKSWIRPAPLLITLLYLFITTALCFMISLQMRILHSVPLLFLILFLATLFSTYSFDYLHLWVPFVSMSLGSLMSYLNAQNLRLQLQEIRSRDLERQKRNLEDLDLLKSNFFSLISHDLKNPIAKIQAVVDRRMYLSELEDEISAMQTIRSISEDQLKSIHNILTTVAVDSGRMPFQLQSVDLGQLLTRVKKQLEPIAESRKINIGLELSPVFLLQLDPLLMSEVFINLIENAIKYSPDQSQIEVKMTEIGNHVQIEISDEGIGIDEDQLESVFQKFKRAENALTVSGTGLGLYLVKYFIELHNGTIKLSARQPRGTLVTVLLPLE